MAKRRHSSRSARQAGDGNEGLLGGMLGIGGASMNANISFSQRGNTTVSGSVDSASLLGARGMKGLQLTASSTKNGASTVGANFNPSGEGPRRGMNYGAN